MNFPTVIHIKKLKIRPIKKRGQNFLVDKNIAEKAVSIGDISAEDTVIEIGPGPGSLTHFLIQTGASVFCFEIDNKLFKILDKLTDTDQNTQIIHKDILKIDFKDYTSQNAKNVLMGSIPYSITTPILLKFLEEGSLFKKAVFIVQKEVAERLCAEPGSRHYGIFSVYCKTYLKSSILKTIPAQCFYPKPKIDSAIIELVPVIGKAWKSDDEKLFRNIVRASFSNRRKTLNNSLKSFLNIKQIDPVLFKTRADESGIDLSRRAETLSVDEFYTLTNITKEILSI